ncbi:MAG: methyltransferase domain-containing protein [Hyphomicrobiaceae bacterium]
MSFEQTQAYDDQLVTLLEALWGKGYLSPGGDDETAMVLAGLDLTGKRIIDIGCGTGGATLFIAERCGAQIVGVDVEAGVIEKATRAATDRGLGDRARFQTLQPGPLPFTDAAFDVVFSKDAVIHIEDKAGWAAEVHRVLKPGGVLAMSDWMRADDGPMSELLRRYIEAEGLGFGAASPDRYFTALRTAGFVEVHYRNRTAWYRDRTKEEVAALDGPLRAELTLKVGHDFLEHELEVWRLLAAVLESGEFGPGHWRALKPA